MADVLRPKVVEDELALIDTPIESQVPALFTVMATVALEVVFAMYPAALPIGLSALPPL